MGTAYGLCILSDLPFRELPACSNTEVVEAHLAWLPPGTIREWGGTYQDEEVTLNYPGLCRIIVTSGEQIRVDGERGAPEEVLEYYVLGVGMGSLLHQRRKLTLHASAVLTPAGAVVFVGESTWGKSTIAAACHAHGWPLIADDVASFEIDVDAGAQIRPAYPSIRLWPATARHFGLLEDSKPIYPGAEKLRVDMRAGFPTEAEETAAIYLLDPGHRLRIETIRPHRAVAEFVRHSFAARALAESTSQSWYFEAASHLTSVVPVKRLSSPATDLAEVAQIVEVVQSDLLI